MKCRYTYSDLRDLDGSLIMVIYNGVRHTGILRAPHFATRKFKVIKEGAYDFSFNLTERLQGVFVLRPVKTSSSICAAGDSV